MKFSQQFEDKEEKTQLKAQAAKNRKADDAKVKRIMDKIRRGNTIEDYLDIDMESLNEI